ncbi:aquaporin AQPAe.a-like isoform X2 [Plodia interpunctella]|uniref:aquaporin AQPAe.a-like isoform X2 n=1 Tax=Plodia interpunctella TaxID=58824 RepID=UPI0023683CED|nr:aquaporin AQPAe.a-like isoform X2 [Plodia interpunctella]
MPHDEERASITTVCYEAGVWRGQAAWRSLAAECCGTALLVALTCLASCADPAPTPLQQALASGLVVAFIVQCFDHVSGSQLNPTVTLAAVVTGRVPALAGALEAAAQLLGALAGGALLRLLAPAPLPHGFCVTRPRQGLSIYKAVGTEALLGAGLALANCASWDARNRCLRDSWPLRIGLTVVAMSLVAGDLTGASMNPARSFAPALWSGDWTNHWVYWAGPLSGSALAGALYRAAWRAPPAAAPRGVLPPSPPAADKLQR